jgi:hypothetical protein
MEDKRALSMSMPIRDWRNILVEEAGLENCGL